MEGDSGGKYDTFCKRNLNPGLENSAFQNPGFVISGIENSEHETSEHANSGFVNSGRKNFGRQSYFSGRHFPCLKGADGGSAVRGRGVMQAKSRLQWCCGAQNAWFWCVVGAVVLVCAPPAWCATDTASENQIFPISELCKGSRHTTRVIVGALVTSNAERELDCEVTFQTDTILQKFMLRFEKIELDCNDHLWVYDSAYSTGTPLKDLSCRDTLQNVPTIYTHSNHVTLKYKTDEWGPLTNGFKLIITAFKHKKDACRDFRCQTTEFCISRVLACDSVNHCGDESDESNSYASCPTPPLGELLSLSAGVLVALGGVLVGLVVLVGVVLVTVVCIRRRRRLALLLQQRHLRSQQHAQYQLGQTEEQYGTNGTYGTVLVEKPPPYPGLPHHTNLGNQDTSPGNLRCPALVDLECRRRWCPEAEGADRLLILLRVLL